MSRVASSELHGLRELYSTKKYVDSEGATQKLPAFQSFTLLSASRKTSKRVYLVLGNGKLAFALGLPVYRAVFNVDSANVEEQVEQHKRALLLEQADDRALDLELRKLAKRG